MGDEAGAARGSALRQWQRFAIAERSLISFCVELVRPSCGLLRGQWRSPASALDCASLAAFAGFQRAVLLAPHGAGNGFRCALAVATAARLLLGWHAMSFLPLEGLLSLEGCESCC